jgi:NTE family protein
MRLFRRPVIGLALGGGGARGLAHIGVLKVFEREGIPIDCLAGASMGGIIAAAYAAGYSASVLEAEALKLANPRHLLRLIDPVPPRRGLFAGERVHAYLSTKLGHETTFDQLRRPLALTAVDARSGTEIVLREGIVVDAVRATMAVPGVFEPVEQDGYSLIDGGVLNNVPADRVRELGAEIVIAVDVNMEPDEAGTWEKAALPGAMVELWRAISIMVVALTEVKLREAQPELVLRPQIPEGVTAFSGLNRASDIIATGEAAAEAVLPILRQLIRPRLSLKRPLLPIQ